MQWFGGTIKRWSLSGTTSLNDRGHLSGTFYGTDPKEDSEEQTSSATLFNFGDMQQGVSRTSSTEESRVSSTDMSGSKEEPIESMKKSLSSTSMEEGLHTLKEKIKENRPCTAEHLKRPDRPGTAEMAKYKRGEKIKSTLNNLLSIAQFSTHDDGTPMNKKDTLKEMTTYIQQVIPSLLINEYNDDFKPYIKNWLRSDAIYSPGYTLVRQWLNQNIIL